MPSSFVRRYRQVIGLQSRRRRSMQATLGRVLREAEPDDSIVEMMLA